MHTDSRRFSKLTETIIGCSYDVANILGRGFMEKVYANALSIELSQRGIRIEKQYPIKVFYKGLMVGDFIADILVEDCILIETKAAAALNNMHMSQCLNYLKASNLNLCLLINFAGPSVQVKRIVNGF